MAEEKTTFLEKIYLLTEPLKCLCFVEETFFAELPKLFSHVLYLVRLA